jgi:hypothetical protein
MSKIYTFASEAPNELFAFASDQSGSSLPEKHGPWKSIGDIGPRDEIPHRLNRRSIEKAIDEHGYQMWRMKKES